MGIVVGPLSGRQMVGAPGVSGSLGVKVPCPARVEVKDERSARASPRGRRPEEAWSENASRWARTGDEAFRPGRAAPRLRSPNPSKDVRVDPAAVRGKLQEVPREICHASSGAFGLRRTRIVSVPFCACPFLRDRSDLIFLVALLGNAEGLLISTVDRSGLGVLWLSLPDCGSWPAQRGACGQPHTCTSHGSCSAGG